MVILTYLTIGLIRLYRFTLSPLLTAIFGHSCRYELPCSEYSITKIKKYGILRGGYLSLIRILSCQPFAKIRPELET